jgi:hypothetical protein
MKTSTALPVRPIADFDSTEVSPRLIRRPKFWLGVMAFSFFAFAVLYGVESGRGHGGLLWIGAPLFILACIGGMRIIDLAHDAKAERSKAFSLYLETFNPELLKLVSASPEYDQETKDAVMQYLSNAHPGWSLK